ncbi:MAG: RNA 2',3'-cyclic phosphodiesterase [Verrucomicrobiota bacterium]
MRLFIAIPVPSEVKIALSEAQARLRTWAVSGDAVRWTPPEQFHLTLIFLGEVAADTVEKISRQAGLICGDFPSLTLCASGIGCFPERGAPRVIWAGIREESGALVELQRALASFFEQQGAKEKFSAHVTLGRLRGVRAGEARRIREQSARCGDFTSCWTAERVELMQSELRASGAVHSRVAVFPFH